MSIRNGKTREGLNPGWLFLTIIAVLLGHYVFLGVSLRLCTNILARESEILLDKIERLPADTPFRLEEEFLQESRQKCGSLADQFRNARNKALEILLALLVPAGAAVSATEVLKTKPREKKPPPVMTPEPPPTPPDSDPITGIDFSSRD